MEDVSASAGADPRLYRPRPPLADFVEYFGYWQREVGEPHRSRALPRGAATVIIDVSGRQRVDFYAGDGRTRLDVPAAFIAKTIDGMLPRFFGLLPRLPYRVEAVPDDIAPFYTGGRYVQAAAGSDEPGTYWVNTNDLKSRPLYVLPSLTLQPSPPQPLPKCDALPAPWLPGPEGLQPLLSRPRRTPRISS